MYKRILLPTDGSPVSRKAVKHGVALAKAVGAKVIGFFAPEDYRALIYTEYVPPVSISHEDFETYARRAADKQLAFVKKTAEAAGVPYESCYMTSIAPWEAIIESARRKRCDLIVMGSHGRTGMAAVLMGSQTTKVLTHSKVPVLVTR